MGICKNLWIFYRIHFMDFHEIRKFYGIPLLDKAVNRPEWVQVWEKCIIDHIGKSNSSWIFKNMKFIINHVHWNSSPWNTKGIPKYIFLSFLQYSSKWMKNIEALTRTGSSSAAILFWRQKSAILFWREKSA